MQKKVFLKLLLNLQENTCVGVSISIKLEAYFVEHMQTADSETSIKH